MEEKTDTLVILTEQGYKQIPRKVRALKSFPLLRKGWPVDVVIKPGETGEYFEHGDCYNFSARDKFIPFIDRKLALSRSIFLEAVNDGNEK